MAGILAFIIIIGLHDEVMRQVGVNGSVIAIYMSDLADMLKQTDRYSIIAINPFTEFDLNMPVEGFLNLFDKED